MINPAVFGTDMRVCQRSLDRDVGVNVNEEKLDTMPFPEVLGKTPYI